MRQFSDRHAENLVLGCALHDLDTARKVVTHARPEDFVDGQSRLIFEALGEVVERGEMPVLEGVRRRLYERGKLEQVGGYTALDDLVALPPSSEHWPTALDSCRRDAYRRQLGARVEVLVQEHDRGADPSALHRKLADTQNELERWLPGFANGDDLETLVSELREERALRIAGEQAPLTWGLPSLDGCMEPTRGHLYLIVGDSSHLKSSLLVHMAASLIRTHRVLVIPFEDQRLQWLVKLTARLSGIPNARILGRGALPKEELQLLDETLAELCDLKTLILPDLNRVRTVADVAALIDTTKPDVVMIDYLQDFPRPYGRQSEEEFLSGLGQELQRLAATSGVCIVTVSSVNREGKALDGRPTLYSIRGSHGLVHSPHGILGLFYPFRHDSANNRMDVVEVALLKNKTGRVANYTAFGVEPGLCRFYDHAARGQGQSTLIREQAREEEPPF